MEGGALMSDEQLKAMKDNKIDSFAFYSDLMYNTINEIKNNEPELYWYAYALYTKFKRLLDKCFEKIKDFEETENYGFDDLIDDLEIDNLTVLNRVHFMFLDNMNVDKNWKEKITNFAIFCYSAVLGFLREMLETL